MKGYKGMNADMTCRGMKYEIGKTYHEDEGIGLCQKGFHFCETLKDVFEYYSRDNGNRFFEVEATGNIMLGNSKCCTSDLTIIKELTGIEANRNCYGVGYGYGYGVGYGVGDGENLHNAVILL